MEISRETLISEIVDYGIIEKANQIRVEAIHPDKKQFENKTLFDKYIDSLYKLRVWTLNKKDELCDYLRLDLDGIFTNYPDIAKDIRDNIDFYQREK